jgi:hypothetical protein
MGTPEAEGGKAGSVRCQEPAGGDAERRVVMEPASATPFELIETELLLEFLVVPLDPPPDFGPPDQHLHRGIRWQGREPALRRSRFSLGPLDQEPLGGA